MRTTYTRVMTGSRVTAPPIDKRCTKTSSGTGVTVMAQNLTFKYPDGAHDAETLIVHPKTGDLYILAKELSGGVYKAEAPFDESSVAALDKVAELSVFANFADLTGGDVSANGRRVAIATYGGWYELVLTSSAIRAHGFDSIWAVKPALIGRGAVAQWEAIAYRQDGRAVLMTSEGSQTPIYGASR